MRWEEEQTKDFEMRARADISEFFRELGPILQKPDGGRVGCCPNCGEQVARISQERGTFACWGCGQGGDVFSVVQLSRKITFQEARFVVMRKLGID